MCVAAGISAGWYSIYSATGLAELSQEENTIGSVPAPVALTRFPLVAGSLVPEVRSAIRVVQAVSVSFTVNVEPLFVYVSPIAAVADVTVNLNRFLFHNSR